MARLARLSIVNVPHHVTQRGNARQCILASDAERAARKLGNFPSVPMFLMAALVANCYEGLK
jgi:hypothetical protein